jgi:hypothetical protein
MAARKTAPSPEPEPPDDGTPSDNGAEQFAAEWEGMKQTLADIKAALQGVDEDDGTTAQSSRTAGTGAQEAGPSVGQSQQAALPPVGAVNGADAVAGREKIKPKPTHWYFKSAPWRRD